MARAEQSLVNNDKLDIDRIMSGGEDMDAENNSPQMPYLKTKIEQDLKIAKKATAHCAIFIRKCQRK